MIQLPGISRVVQQFVTDMQIAGYSPVTIRDRVKLVERFRATLDCPLLDAGSADIRTFQALFIDRAPATTNLYARHIKAFFDWAAKRKLIGENPADEMTVPRAPKGRPHPTSLDDLRVILACASDPLRIAYTLAAFSGLRRGEICELQRCDIDLDGDLSTALIHGKGRKERTVPLLRPVVDELERHGLPARGWVVKRKGHRYDPDRLSVDSTQFLRGLGMATTLHSMRGTFATQAARLTRDPMLVRDVLGHESVATTEVYMQTSLADAHLRLAGVTALASDLLANGRGAGEQLALRVVR